LSWREPTDYERELLATTRRDRPRVVRLAELLCLAPRIEPLLLRNARRRWLPSLPAELESQLWFSPLVASRSTREVILHLGVAKLLADRLAGQRLDDTGPGRQAPGADSLRLDRIWAFTRHHSRHWSAEERLDRDLRYHALRNDRDALRDGLKAILERIQREDDPGQRLQLARLAKRSLAVIAPPGAGAAGAPLREAQILAQYAALALGDSGRWVQPGPPQALPAALAARLPPPIALAELGCELHGYRR